METCYGEVKLICSLMYVFSFGDRKVIEITYCMMTDYMQGSIHYCLHLLGLLPFVPIYLAISRSFFAISSYCFWSWSYCYFSWTCSFFSWLSCLSSCSSLLFSCSYYVDSSCSFSKLDIVRIFSLNFAGSTCLSFFLMSLCLADWASLLVLASGYGCSISSLAEWDASLVSSGTFSVIPNLLSSFWWRRSVFAYSVNFPRCALSLSISAKSSCWNKRFESSLIQPIHCLAM